MSQSFTEVSTSTDDLEIRLAVNRAYSSTNFDDWLLSRLPVAKASHVLDVSYGTGSQTAALADLVGAEGSVSALAISDASLALLNSRLRPGHNVQAVVGDMDMLAGLVRDSFTTKRYDLVQSSYAICYASDVIAVRGTMFNVVKDGGYCSVFVPNAPHGLVELVSNHTSIPLKVTNSLNVGLAVIKPFFEKHYRNIQIPRFNNFVRIPNVDALIEYYCGTSYHSYYVKNVFVRTLPSSLR